MSIGRILTDYEQEAWQKYDQLIDKYKVRNYDRISVHDAFPDIKQAFDHACATSTFYRLCQKKTS